MKKNLRSRLSPAAIAVAICLSVSCDPGIQSEQIFSTEAETFRLTGNQWPAYSPAWSPDGKMIAYSQYEPSTRLLKLFVDSKKTEPLLDENELYNNVKLSPDGGNIVYSSFLKRYLRVRSLQNGSDKILAPDYLGAFGPIWSPDGKWIAFNYSADRTGFGIWIIPAEGGAARQIFPNDHLNYCHSFSPDGNKIALYSRRSGNYEIWTVDVGTGEQQQLTVPPNEKRFPAWSPDGATIAYVGYEDSCSARSSTIWLLPAAGGQARELVTFDGIINQLQWSPDGASLVTKGGSLPSVLVVEAANGKFTRLIYPRAENLSWFPDSRSLFMTESAISYSIFLAAVDDKQTRRLSDRKIDEAFNPIWLNGSEVAFLRLNQFWKISIFGENSVRLDLDSTILGKSNLALSPDRAQLLFDNGYNEIYLQALAGGPAINLTAHISEPLADPAWSPDGKHIVCRNYSGLKIFALVSDKLVERKSLSGLYSEPAWSPTETFGTPIAFFSLGGIYLTALDNPEPRLAVQTGQSPAWSPDGRRLAYVRERDIFVTKIFAELK